MCGARTARTKPRSLPCSTRLMNCASGLLGANPGARRGPWGGPKGPFGALGGTQGPLRGPWGGELRGLLRGPRGSSGPPLGGGIAQTRGLPARRRFHWEGRWGEPGAWRDLGRAASVEIRKRSKGYGAERGNCGRVRRQGHPTGTRRTKLPKGRKSEADRAFFRLESARG